MTPEKQKEFFSKFTNPDYGWGSEGYDVEFKKGSRIVHELVDWIEAYKNEEVRKGIREFARNIDKDLMFPIDRKFKDEIVYLADRYIVKFLHRKDE